MTPAMLVLLCNDHVFPNFPITAWTIRECVLDMLTHDCAERICGIVVDQRTWFDVWETAMPAGEGVERFDTHAESDCEVIMIEV